MLLPSFGLFADVSPPSDVLLFATGQSTLSSQACAAISDAVRRIEDSADGGEIRVIGHTDDVDTDEVNQALSEQRAATVAEVLTAELPPGERDSLLRGFASAVYDQRRNQSKRFA